MVAWAASTLLMSPVAGFGEEGLSVGLERGW